MLPFVYKVHWLDMDQGNDMADYRHAHILVEPRCKVNHRVPRHMSRANDTAAHTHGHMAEQYRNATCSESLRFPCNKEHWRQCFCHIGMDDASGPCMADIQGIRGMRVGIARDVHTWVAFGMDVDTVVTLSHKRWVDTTNKHVNQKQTNSVSNERTSRVMPQ